MCDHLIELVAKAYLAIENASKPPEVQIKNSYVAFMICYHQPLSEIRYLIEILSATEVNLIVQHNVTLLDLHERAKNIIDNSESKKTT